MPKRGYRQTDEHRAKRAAAARKYGAAHAYELPEWWLWHAIKKRCYTPGTTGFKNYGGRGITMAPAWRDSFITFLRDMGPRPPGTSIDRIDNDGPYAPGNCRWATPSVQNRNNRRSRFLTFNGETLNLVDWAARLGVDRSRISERLRYGWPVERVLQGTAPRP